MSPFHSKTGKKDTSNIQGFTLVEILVATSVLAMMGLMMTTLLDSASLTIANSTKHLSADDQARLVFDRMQMDLARMLKRNDVYFSFLKQTGNDEMTFYSETPGYFGGTVGAPNQSNLSLVDYEFNNSTQLIRLSQGYQWTDINFSPSTAPALNTANSHILSNSIFRVEVAFLVSTGDTTLQITGTAPTPGTQTIQNLRAVIVALAALDSKSQKLVSPTSYPSLIAAFPDFTGNQTITLSTTSSPVASTIDPILSSWRTAMNASNFAQTAGIPKQAAQQVRIYQRIIYLQ